MLFTIVSWVIAFAAWATGHGDDGGMWQHWDDRFTDLTHYDEVFTHLHQAQFFTGAERFAYPAPAAILYDLLLHFGPLRLGIFIAFTLLLAVVSAVLLARALVRRGIHGRSAAVFTSLMVLTSWPLLFLIERGNIESFLIFLMILGSVLYWRGRPEAAAVLWGLAASVKIYPAVLLVLFLNREQIRSFLVGAATFAASLLLSFLFVGPTVAIAAHGTLHGINGFVSSYANHSRKMELRFDHSYLAFFKTPLAIGPLHLSPDVSRLGTFYLIAAVTSAVILYFTHFRKLPRVNQFMLVSLAMVSLPPVSYDYTLFHLYPSFVLLIFITLWARAQAQEITALKTLFLCFAALLASENFVYWLGFHLNGPIKAVALFTATITLLRHPLPEIFPGEKNYVAI